jgi:REP element-mobilizing transposase RayT
MRQVQFVPDQYYHVFNHGTEEREVFQSADDYKRFLISLIVFNDTKASLHNLGRFVHDPGFLIKSYNPDQRNNLVEIIVFTLLPTHFHLFLKEKERGGISLFMHRLSKGYSRYFNLKYERNGTLWQGPFKAKLIDEEPYFVHIISYIHLNILDLYFSDWREGNFDDWKTAESKMRKYSWSSYVYHRTGKSDVSFMDLILQKQDWFSDYFPSSKDFEKNLQLWFQRAK